MSSFHNRTAEPERPIDPERQAAVTSLSNANKALYQGPIDAIHNPKTAMKTLVSRGLILRLGRHIAGDGLTVRWGHHENMEGSYYIGHKNSTLRYRVNGDHYAFLNQKKLFDFSHENPEVDVSADLETAGIEALVPWLESLKRVLDQGLQEAKTELESAPTSLDEHEKEQVATALLQLNRLKTQSPVILEGEGSAALLLWASIYPEALGVRLNPAIVEAMVRDIDTIRNGVERQASFHRSKRAPEGILERVRNAVTKMMHRTPGSSTAQEPTRQEGIQAAKAQQLNELGILREKVSNLSDPALGMELGSDAFVSKSLEFLGYKKPQMAVGEA